MTLRVLLVTLVIKLSSFSALLPEVTAQNYFRTGYKVGVPQHRYYHDNVEHVYNSKPYISGGDVPHSYIIPGVQHPPSVARPEAYPPTRYDTGWDGAKHPDQDHPVYSKDVFGRPGHGFGVEGFNPQGFPGYSREFTYNPYPWEGKDDNKKERYGLPGYREDFNYKPDSREDKDDDKKAPHGLPDYRGGFNYKPDSREDKDDDKEEPHGLPGYREGFNYKAAPRKDKDDDKKGLHGLPGYRGAFNYKPDPREYQNPGQGDSPSHGGPAALGRRDLVPQTTSSPAYGGDFNYNPDPREYQNPSQSDSPSNGDPAVFGRRDLVPQTIPSPAYGKVPARSSRVYQAVQKRRKYICQGKKN